VGEHVATAIRLMPELMRRYELSRSDLKGILYTTEDIGEFLQPYFFGARNEMIYMISMDAKGKVLNCDRLGEGSLNETSLSSRKVVETALANRASSVVLAHNHTSGIAIPSREDVAATLMMRNVLEAMGIELVDHLVVADEDYISMKDSGMLQGK
jgi:DNA repair protein RadC